MTPHALAQLTRAKLRAVVTVVYVALLEHLDPGEYRAVSASALEATTGLSRACIWQCLTTLTQHGFLDRRGINPHKYRLLTSQRRSTPVESGDGAPMPDRAA